LGALEALDLADLGGDREREDRADPGDREQQGNIRVVRVGVFEPAVGLGDLALEVVDQRKRGADVASPGLGDVEAGEQRSTFDPEQV